MQQHRSGSTLVQVMAWCLMVTEVYWQSCRSQWPVDGCHFCMLWQSYSSVCWQLCQNQWPVDGCCLCRWCTCCGRAPATSVGSCVRVSDLWMVVFIAGDTHVVAELLQCMLAVVPESVTCKWLFLLQVMPMLWPSSSSVCWQLCQSQWPVAGCCCRWCPCGGRAPAMFVGSCARVSDLWMAVVVAGDAHVVAELQQCLLAVVNSNNPNYFIVPKSVTCGRLLLLQVMPMLWQSSSNVCWQLWTLTTQTISLCQSQWPVDGCCYCRWCPCCGRAPAMFVGSCEL